MLDGFQHKHDEKYSPYPDMNDAFRSDGWENCYAMDGSISSIRLLTFHWYYLNATEYISFWLMLSMQFLVI